MRVRSLGQEDPLEERLATHYSILAWRIPWTEEPGRLQSMGLQRVGHDWASDCAHAHAHTHTHTHTHTHISESFETMSRYIISLRREKTFFFQTVQRFVLITGKIESSMNGHLCVWWGFNHISPLLPLRGHPLESRPPPPLSCSCDTAQEHEGEPTYLLTILCPNHTVSGVFKGGPPPAAASLGYSSDTQALRPPPRLTE